MISYEGGGLKILYYCFYQFSWVVLFVLKMYSFLQH